LGCVKGGFSVPFLVVVVFSGGKKLAPSCSIEMSIALGFGAAAVSVFLFGTTALPVKKFETGDGMFFQWVSCAAIWIAGLITNLVLGQPPFEPFAMLGGALWCTGNIFVVPIVKTIGLGLGLVLWGMSNLIMGWASGEFGLFGLTKQTVPHPALNYIGFSLAMLSTIAFMFVRPTVASRVADQDAAESIKPDPSINDNDSNVTVDAERHPLLSDVGMDPVDGSREPESWVEKLSPIQKRVLGVVLALVSGVFYGVNFDPPQLLVDQCKEKKDQGDCSTELMDYIFSHFSGIFLASTVYLAIYCAVTRNKPTIYPESVLPALAYGAMWAGADIAWFIANGALSLVVAFPIITTGPGVVGSLWGIFLFKEIQGRRNLLAWGVAVLITIAGVVLIALSKV
jgi:Transmembrane family, TMEM144 of transporters